MKILNLYAGIGGNRRLWNTHNVTAVEIDPAIAEAYQFNFPSDLVIVGDAHQYLLRHYQEYDFIWSSTPCPTHGQYRYNVGVRAKGYAAVYPDMALYQEIIFLQYYFKGKWVVENTISFYEPLIKPQKISRHYFWANFVIPPIQIKSIRLRDKNKISEMEEATGFDLSETSIPNKRQVLRNCVNPWLGLHILNVAQNK